MPVDETVLKPEVFDQLQHAMAADPAGFTELYRDYLADAWQALRKLRDAVQQREADEVRAKAHHLKGSSLVIGARAVAQYAAMMEDAGRASDFRQAESALQDTHQALQEVQNALAGRLGSDVVPAGKTAT